MTLPCLTRDEAAWVIAARLRALAAGPLDAPRTWQEVAARLCLRYEECNAPGRSRGEYHPSPGEGAACGIVVNTAYPESEQARAAIHEIAHHALHVWIPPQLTDAADCYCYAGDVDEARHDIARAVEALVMCG